MSDNKTYDHIMVDLETLSSRPNACILAIGAVAFNIGQPRHEWEDFYALVSPQSCVDAGLHLDPGTVLWWMQQSGEARASVAAAGNGPPLGPVLAAFRTWTERFAHERTKIWGNGSDFDNVILASAYRAIGAKEPWGHRQNACYRTIKGLFPDEAFKPAESALKHHALEDARWQAEHLNNILLGVPSPRDRRLKDAQRELALYPAAVSGKEGRHTLFRAIRLLKEGHKLSREEAQGLLPAYNARCQPPWPLDALALCVDEVYGATQP